MHETTKFGGNEGNASSFPRRILKFLEISLLFSLPNVGHRRVSSSSYEPPCLRIIVRSVVFSTRYFVSNKRVDFEKKRKKNSDLSSITGTNPDCEVLARDRSVLHPARRGRNRIASRWTSAFRAIALVRNYRVLRWKNAFEARRGQPKKSERLYFSEANTFDRSAVARRFGGNRESGDSYLHDFGETRQNAM